MNEYKLYRNTVKPMKVWTEPNCWLMLTPSISKEQCPVEGSMPLTAACGEQGQESDHKFKASQPVYLAKINQDYIVSFRPARTK